MTVRAGAAGPSAWCSWAGWARLALAGGRAIPSLCWRPSRVPAIQHLVIEAWLCTGRRVQSGWEPPGYSGHRHVMAEGEHSALWPPVGWSTGRRLRVIPGWAVFASQLPGSRWHPVSASVSREGMAAPRTELALPRAKRDEFRCLLVSGMEKAGRTTHGPRLYLELASSVRPESTPARQHSSSAVQPLGGDSRPPSPAAPWGRPRRAPSERSSCRAAAGGPSGAQLWRRLCLCSWDAEPSLTVRGSQQVTSDRESPSKSALCDSEAVPWPPSWCRRGLRPWSVQVTCP